LSPYLKERQVAIAKTLDTGKDKRTRVYPPIPLYEEL
jgi:hypothetical protein